MSRPGPAPAPDFRRPPYDESKVRAVGCPHCGAKSGKRCLTSNGQIVRYGFHMRRKAVPYPRYGENKKGLAAPQFDADEVKCVRCGEDGVTAPHRAPFRADIDPPGCAVCIQEVWAEATASPSATPSPRSEPLHAAAG